MPKRVAAFLLQCCAAVSACAPAGGDDGETFSSEESSGGLLDVPEVAAPGDPSVPGGPEECLGWFGDSPDDCGTEAAAAWNCALSRPCGEARFVYADDGAVEVDLDAARCIVRALRWGSPSRLQWSWTDETGDRSGRAELHVVAEQFVLLDLEVRDDAAACDEPTLRLHSGRAHVREPLDPLYDRCLAATTGAEFATCFFGGRRPLEEVDTPIEPPFPWMSGACDFSGPPTCPG